MKDFFQLKKNLKKDLTGFKKIKVALLGDTATQFLKQSLVAVAYEYQLHLDIFEADFDQIERQIFDQGSELYEHQPEFVILFQSTHKLLSKYNKMPGNERLKLAEKQIEI